MIKKRLTKEIIDQTITYVFIEMQLFFTDYTGFKDLAGETKIGDILDMRGWDGGWSIREVIQSRAASMCTTLQISIETVSYVNKMSEACEALKRITRNTVVDDTAVVDFFSKLSVADVRSYVYRGYSSEFGF